MNKSDLKLAIQAALEGDWEASHKIAQSYSDSTSNWLHAVLHKIEGDEGNSRYWYARAAGQYYEEFVDTEKELKFMLAKIS